jgi:beta-glucanase (GH16 family)
MRTLIAIVFAAVVAAPCVQAQPAPAQTSWQLVWSDEFNGPAGSQPNPTYWTYDLGTDCCGNQELETYTNAAENAHMDGLGHLDIHIENPSPGVYTSARIKTEGLWGIEYGRIESRIKVPFGQGMWPAFWMLGDNITTVNWPACGEIDIMENVGFTPGVAYGSLHGPTATTRRRSISCPPEISPTIFMYSPSSGRRSRLLSTWMAISTRPRPTQEAAGSSTSPTIPSSSS